MAQHYEAAGVNLEAGYEVVSRITFLKFRRSHRTYQRRLYSQFR